MTTEVVSATTQTEVDDVLCDNLKTADTNIPSDNDFLLLGSTSLDYLVGVALTGGLIYNGLSETTSADPFFPPSGTNAENFDTCMNHIGSDGLIHYHCMPDCNIRKAYGEVSGF